MVSEHKMEISSKVFKDDFKLVMYHLFEKEIDLEDSAVLNKNLDLIYDYYISHLKINDGKEKLVLNMDNITTDQEYLLFHSTIELKKDTEQLEIVNTILLDLYFDQKNMMIFGYREKERGYLFNIRETKHLIILDEF